MNIFTSIKMALKNIRSNKVRAILTMLGIIIGVSSVIVLVSIGEGSSKSVAANINSLGTNLITVSISNTDTPYTLDDVNKISKLNNIKHVSPVLTGRATLKNGETTSQTSLTGTTSDYESVRNVSVQSGRFISAVDMDFRQKVAVLGSDTAATLFAGKSPVNQTVLVNGESYKIVGVLNSKGGSMGQNQDDSIIIPFSTAQRLLKTTHIQQLYAQATSEGAVTPAMSSINRLLFQTFNGDSDSFSVFNQQDVVDTMSSVSKTMTMMLGGIASISLLVGGIGIMNIMFVSVTERTKEIGIRKAIGAKGKDILSQFLIEAIVLSAMGGILGVGIGMAATKIYTMATGSMAAYSLPVILSAFLFSVAVGVVFGVFPANKASRLHPIQALRFE